MTSQTQERYKPAWTIGDKLRRIRRDAGKTQAAFAALLSVGDKQYAAWEADTSSPPSDLLLTLARRIADIYGREASLWLLGVDDAPPPPEPPSIDRAGRIDALNELTRAKAARAARHAGSDTLRYLSAA